MGTLFTCRPLNPKPYTVKEEGTKRSGILAVEAMSKQDPFIGFDRVR